MTQDHSSGRPGQSGKCGCGSIPGAQPRPAANVASDLHAHVRDVSEFLDLGRHRVFNPNSSMTSLNPRPSARLYEQMERLVRAAVDNPRKMWELTRILGSLGLGNTGSSYMAHTGDPAEAPACPGPDLVTDEQGNVLYVRGYYPAVCLDCSSSVPACNVFFAGDETTGVAKIPYVTHTAGDLDGPPDDTVDHVILAIHGTFSWITPDEDTAPYFPTDFDLAGNPSPAHAIYGQMHLGLAEHQLALLAANPVVIAPLFQRKDYMPYTDIMPWAVYWNAHSGDGTSTSSGGDASRFNLNDFPEPYKPAQPLNYPLLSSYTYLDIILRKAAVKYPAASKFTMVGHSAGAQTVERYAMFDNGMSAFLGLGWWGGHSINLRYVVLNAAHCWLTPLRPIWNGLSLNPVPSEEEMEKFAGPQPDVTWKVPDCSAGDSSCQDYDTWAWGCGKFATQNNPRRQQAFNWVKSRYAYMNNLDDKRQFIAMHYIVQNVYHFQQMGDNKIDANNSRLAQMGRSVWERFVNFKHSFHHINLEPWVSHAELVAWAHKRFIGISVLDPYKDQYGNTQDTFHDQAWMLKHPQVLAAMGLLDPMLLP